MISYKLHRSDYDKKEDPQPKQEEDYLTAAYSSYSKCQMVEPLKKDTTPNSCSIFNGKKMF